MRRFICWLLGHDAVASEWHDEGSLLLECARCGAVDIAPPEREAQP